MSASEGIGKKAIWRARARVFGLPAGEHQIFVHAELSGGVRWRRYSQAPPDRRSAPLPLFRDILQKGIPSPRAQDRIAQKFEALVVLPPRRAIFVEK